MGLLMLAYEQGNETGQEDKKGRFKEALKDVFIRRRDLKYSQKIKGYSVDQSN